MEGGRKPPDLFKGSSIKMPQNFIDGKRHNEATITKIMNHGTIVETQGACKWSRKCKSYNVVLGNGLCEECWDNGGRPLGKRGKQIKNERERKDDLIIERYLSRVRGDYYKG